MKDDVVLAVDGDVVLFAASTEPTDVSVWTWSRAGGVMKAPGHDRPGVAAGWRAGGTTVLAERRLDIAGWEHSFGATGGNS